MSELFPNHTIDIEKGTVYSNRLKKFTGQFCENDYQKCRVKDVYGNEYQKIHQVIIAEKLQLPKHLWPVDENGRRYVVDHIIPVKNGGTNDADNLHLIPKPENNKNPLSKENYRKAAYRKWKNPLTRKIFSEKMKGKLLNRLDLSKKVFHFTSDGVLVKILDSVNECSRNGYNKGHVAACCRGEEKTHKGYMWSYVTLNT